jgi:hypothetical protein
MVYSLLLEDVATGDRRRNPLRGAVIRQLNSLKGSLVTHGENFLSLLPISVGASPHDGI